MELPGHSADRNGAEPLRRYQRIAALGGVYSNHLALAALLDDAARPDAVAKIHRRRRRTARENLADLVDGGPPDIRGRAGSQIHLIRAHEVEHLLHERLEPDRLAHDLLRRLTQAGVDHLHARIAQGRGRFGGLDPFQAVAGHVGQVVVG